MRIKVEGKEPLAKEGERSGTISNKGKTFIGPLKREREMLDSNGNVIDPKTKAIIRLADKACRSIMYRQDH